MSQGKPRKRDRLHAFFRRSESPSENHVSSRSGATGGSPIRISGANFSPSTSVLGVTVGPNETTTSSAPRAPSPSTQQSIQPTEPSVETQPGVTTRDATLKSNPTSHPGPSSATAMANNAVTTKDTATAKGRAHTRLLVGKEGKPISTATSNAGSPHLWSRAFNGSELSSQERETLADVGIETDTQQIASTLGTMTKGIVDEKKGKDWKIQFKGEEIVMRDVGMKILRWLDRFKEIGDIIAQYDPGHAALPWAGFRFLLKVTKLSFRSIKSNQPANDIAHSSAWISRKRWMRSW